MGGNNRQKKSSSSFSVFNLFKPRRPRRSGDDYSTMQGDAPSPGPRVCPSDEDKGRWPVALPGIDKKAEEFITNFHKNIAMDSELKIIPNRPGTSTTGTAAKV